MGQALFFSQLAIDGACPPMPLMHGGIYAIAEEEERFADAVLWNTLADHCTAGGSACLVCPDPAASISLPVLASRAHAACASSRLAIFGTGHASATPDGDHYVQRLLADLQHWRGDGAQLLVIDDAGRWAAAASQTGLRRLQDWAEEQRAAVILLFRRGAAGDDGSAGLMPLAHRFAGMARIGSRYGVTSWDIFHWFGPSGLLAKTSYPLRLNAAHRLESPPEQTAQAAVPEPARDERRVLAQRSAFLSGETPASDWRIAGDHDSVLTQLGAAIAATVVLSFTPGADYVALARCVFTLRQRCGVRLKIVVREVNSRLRHSQESLIARVGANLIVPAEISYARFLSLTSMVQGQVFPHAIPATFEQAMREAMPDAEQGYLAPQAFLRSAAGMLERSRSLQVQNVLLRLPLAYGLLPLDALRYCRIKRAGDLATADDRSVYLFLYACREADIEKTLERLFSLPVSELFSTEDRFLSPHTIGHALVELDERHRQQAYPDLSGDLSAELSAALAAAAVPPVSVPVAAPAAPKGPPVLRYPAPPAAVRRPLRIKGAPTLTDVSLTDVSIALP